jgi:probable HAF family extracellular repeat protein
MKKIVVLLFVSALILMAEDVFPQCVNIAGTWNYSVSGTLDCSVAGQSDTEPYHDNGTLTITQNSCSITIQTQGNPDRDYGTVSGNSIGVNGPFLVPPSAPGFTFSQNSMTLSGTISTDGTSANLTGSFSASGTSGSNPFQCTITDLAVALTRSSPPLLTLTPSGTGSGTITSSPSGISCGTTCSASFLLGSAVTLTPTPASGSYFLTWTAPCSWTPTCSLTLDANTEVTAYFGLQAPAYYDTVQKVYIGYYQRPADPVGLLYWAERLQGSLGNLDDIIEAYAHSAEAQALYGPITSGNIASVINAIYRALFNRDAETAGLNYYVGAFNAGQFTAATIMLNVLNGAQNEDLQSVNNKLATSTLFTRTIDPEYDGVNFQVTYAGDSDAIKARTFLATVTSDSGTIPTQSAMTTWMKNNIADPGDPLYGPDAPYAYITLLPTDWTDAFGTSINDSGQVSGYGTEPLGYSRGFRYAAGSYTTLSPIGWTDSFSTCINNSGQTAGYGYDASGYSRAYRYSGGSYTALLPTGWTEAYAWAINSNGDVVGDGWDASDEYHAFIYANGSYTTLNPGGWSETDAMAINNSGQVAGYGWDASDNPRAFLYSSGTYITLLPPGWSQASAFGINNYGHVVGTGTDSSGQAGGFLYINGAYTTLNPEGWTDVYAVAINDSGMIAGCGTDSSGQPRAFVYSNGTYTTVHPEGWQESFASGINSSGQLVGYGTDGSGNGRGFIATPR